MSIKDDFKNHIRAGEIAEALALAISEATELEVITHIAGSNRDQSNYLRTRINLLEGQIENELADDIVENSSYRQLYQFHLEQVNEAQSIMFHSLQALQKTLMMLKATRSPQLPPHNTLIQ